MLADDIYEMTDKSIVRELGQRFKAYRLHRQLTQKEVAGQVGTSVFTVSSLEKGTATGLSLSLFVRLLRGINELDRVRDLLPEIPPSPRRLFEHQQRGTTIHRVRKAKGGKP